MIKASKRPDVPTGQPVSARSTAGSRLSHELPSASLMVTLLFEPPGLGLNSILWEGFPYLFRKEEEPDLASEDPGLGWALLGGPTQPGFPKAPEGERRVVEDRPRGTGQPDSPHLGTQKQQLCPPYLRCDVGFHVCVWGGRWLCRKKKRLKTTA